MFRITYIILLSVFIQACNTWQAGRNDVIDENGWIGISEAPQPCGYYLVDGKIYAFEIEMPDTVGINDLVKDYALLNAHPISCADSKSFSVYINKDKERYAKDNKNVYYAGNGELIDGVNFEIIDNTFTVKIIDAVPHTFRYIDCGYATDGSNVFYQGNKIASADPQTFKSIGGGYAFDCNFAYDRERKLVNIDQQTFDYILLESDSIDMNDFELWYSKIKWMNKCQNK